MVWRAEKRRTGNLPRGTEEMALNLGGGVIQQPPKSHRIVLGKNYPEVYNRAMGRRDDIARNGGLSSRSLV